MTYQKIFDLKFKKGLSTYELVRLYPNEVERVSEVALLDIPEEILREVVTEEKDLYRLIQLKRRLFGKG